VLDQALARNIAKMASLFGEEYKFVPKSYQARTLSHPGGSSPAFWF
jgi:hypothetical protein